jgi:hypothetical protein
MKGAGSTAMCAAQQYGSATEIEGQAYDVDCLPLRRSFKFEEEGGGRLIDASQKRRRLLLPSLRYAETSSERLKMPRLAPVKAFCR